ncbi:hypothetical protein PFICI_03899 [Pestalotiopsis fici W106-1]|uniref:Uncharacterized protein n=1 Tax=Pestalotiopsis fici (strain W106-1 / CGMCC3.15140) TaxID=1229662 RepID=W3XIP2_PESFW|nr:uncharacterized protein PFICI_03899 [Pestalotiopsis fici W106-1]ETS85874.1 hypothetical protein PFICI_03899 [Pestalotiopsis fici W106-1]
MAAENFSLREIIKYGLISLGYVADPGAFRIAQDLPFHSWSILVLPPLLSLTDIEEIARAGVETLLGLAGPESWTGQLSPIALAASKVCLSSMVPPVIGDPIYTIRTGFLTASHANCRILGFDPQVILQHHAKSPFVNTAHAMSCGTFNTGISGATEMQQYRSQKVINDMHPTLEQLTIPHHPYLDLIPWPSFRSRAIIASSMNPPLIDKNELCLDLLSDGLCCHGIPGVSLHGRGEGTPWDSRSWEARPWFLQKWSYLTGGSDVQQTSLWWRLRS